MMEQAGLLDRLAESDARGCRDQDGLLSVTLLQQLPEPAVRNILRHSFAKAGVQIPAARRLYALSAQLLTAQSDTEALVRMGSIGVHVWRDRIWLDPAMDQRCPGEYALQSGSVAWPDGQLEIVGAYAAERVLHVAPLGHGQRFHPTGRCRDRVSELLRAQGVPPWVRPRLPGLWLDKTLLWLPGLGWASDVHQFINSVFDEPSWQETPALRL